MSTTSLDSFSTIGINHWLAPIEIREQFSLSNQQQLLLLDDAKSRGIESLLVYSTCNRTELFARNCSGEILAELLVAYSKGTTEQFKTFGFETYGEDAAKHLYKVAVGLDAQILGDLQIIKQIKTAYEDSRSLGIVDGMMHRLVQSVFKAHKQIRTETNLGEGSASVASAAVRFAQNNIQNLREKRVLLVGTGKIGKITCKNLVTLGLSEITLINRNSDRAADLADKFNINYQSFDYLPEAIAKADLIIVATGATTPILTKSHFDDIEITTPKILLDLSVPRNIDPEIDTLQGIRLANMDDLGNETDEAWKKRKASVPLAHQIIRSELQEYRNWLSDQKIVPTIKALNKKLQSIREEELKRFQNQVSDAEFKKVELLTHRIVNKIAGRSIELLKDDSPNQDQISELVKTMFNLDLEEEQLDNAE